MEKERYGLVELLGKNMNAPFLRDKDMKDMMPLFVESDQPDDHKCGTCFMRIILEKQKRSDCTTVEGGINLKNGSCMFWSPGEASKPEDKTETRVSYDTAGYVEVPEGEKINCYTCAKHFKKIDDKIGYCTKWEGRVKNGQCCIAWENEDISTVPIPLIGVK